MQGSPCQNITEARWTSSRRPRARRSPVPSHRALAPSALLRESHPRLAARHAEDPKPGIDTACHNRCASAHAAYLKCSERIEAKGSGDCGSWYMDYFS